MAGKRSVAFYNLDGDSAKGAFAERLYSRMVELGWNQSELARQAAKYLPPPVKGQKQNKDLGRDLVSHWVRGKALPRPTALKAIAKALGCKESDLLPPRSVPTVAAERIDSSFTIQDRGEGTAFLEVRRVMPMAKAMKIIALLNEPEK